MSSATIFLSFSIHFICPVHLKIALLLKQIYKKDEKHTFIAIH
jgi:hypothetical protein